MDTSSVWRDLHWLIHSPDLLSEAAGLPLASWPSPVLHDVDCWLERERDTPKVLVAAFACPYRRLGLYAEALLGTVLQHAASVQLLAHHTAIHINLPGTGGARQTMGELDYVWRDRQDDKVWHWELAVKLYLYLPGIAAQADGTEKFVGVQRRDTLARKIARLRDHQLALSALPQVVQMLGTSVDGAMACVKGWLFYPLQGLHWDDYVLADQATRAMLNPQHLRGWWLTRREFVRRLSPDPGAGADTPINHDNEDTGTRGNAGHVDDLRKKALRWRILPRMQWLARHRADVADTLDEPALLAAVQSWFSATLSGSGTGPRPALLVVALVPQSDITATDTPTATDAQAAKVYVETHRGFVVADDWTDSDLPKAGIGN